MSSPPKDNIMQVETGLKPTQVAMPADAAHEGVNVTTGDATRSTASADPLLADKPVLSDTHEVMGRGATTEAHKFTAPKEDDSSIAKLTTGLGGMAITAPLAGLEKLSPTLAHGVQAVGSSLVDMAHSLTGTGPQYTSAEPIIDTSGLPDTNQVASTLSSTAHKVQETVQPVVSQAYESAKPVVANAAQQVQETVKPAASSATQSVQQNLPQSLGGQATSQPSASSQLGQQPSSRETGVDLSMEPAGARKQVHPVGAGGTSSLTHDTAMTSTSTTSTSTPAPAHGYVETAMDAVRGASNYLSHLLPGPEKQQQMSETAAHGLERAPEVASNVAQSTASGLASAAQTTAAVAGPAASSAASMGATAAHSLADAATYVAGSVSSAASVASTAVADTAQHAAATAHLPGWNAPAPTSSSSADAPATAGRGFSSPLEPSTPSADSATLGSGPMGGSDPSTTGDQVSLVKNYLRDEQGSSSSDRHNADKQDLPALTQEADPSTRNMSEDKGFDLRRTHDERALDQQVSTHDPDARFSTSTSSATSGTPVFSPERASRAHSDTDIDRPTHPGTSSVPSSQAVGTATILSHEVIGGPASSAQQGSSSPAFAQPSPASAQHGAGAGFERFAPTAQQSSGGKDDRLEGKTADFMPHKSSGSSSSLVHGQSSTSTVHHHHPPTRDDMHTPSHVDDSHWGGEPTLSGAGSPRTYSATHPDSQPKTTRDASSTHGASSSSTTEQHPTFTKAEAEFPPSGGSHAGEAFSSFGPGQPPATGPSAYGGGILKSAPAAHLSAAPQQHRGDSDPFQADQPLSSSSKVESAAAHLGSTTSPSTSHEHGHHHHQQQHSATSPSSSTLPSSQHHDSTSASSASQGGGVSGLKYTNPLDGTTTPASPQSSAMPKPESQHLHSSSTASAPQPQHDAQASSTTTAGRGAPLAGSTSKTSETSTSHGTPAWVNKASAERKTDYPTHESAAAPSSSSTSSTTGSSAQQSHDSHKPTLKERVKDVFHHSSAH